MNEVEVQQRETTPDELAASAAGPVRWLLECARTGGVPLTQTNALARAVVREAAERWPDWWDAELFGQPHREMDMARLEALREGLLRMRLVRRRGRKLLATTRGRKLAADPIALTYELALDLGGGDQFAAWVADRVVDELSESESRTHDQLVAPAQAAAQSGWRDTTGNPPSERGISWVVSDVLCRGEAYGLVERKRDPDEPKSYRALISLTPAARLVLGTSRKEVAGCSILVFEAELLNVRGVSARVAVAGHEHLSDLHGAIQQAFNWDDDHLYSFWLDGEYWGDDRTEFVRPGTPDTNSRSADVPVADLALTIGARVAYVFDYGDEWRVMLTLRERVDRTSATPRVTERCGTAPPQYPPLDDE